jgi:hypothetical protein
MWRASIELSNKATVFSRFGKLGDRAAPTPPEI